MRWRLSPYVPGDIEEIVDYIARDSPRHAASVVRLLRKSLAEIAREPLLYRVRTELGPDVRLASVGSYCILFRIHNGLVRIERIVHGSRDLPGLLEGDRQSAIE